MTAPLNDFPTHPALDFAVSGGRAADMLRKLDITIPEPGFGKAKLVISGVKVPTQFSYQGDVYLMPRNIDFNPQERGFRQKYYVDLFSIMAQPSEDDEEEEFGAQPPAKEPESVPTARIVVNLTPHLQALAGSHAGEHWVIMVALAPHNLMGESVEAFAEKVLRPGTSLGEFLNFEDMKLVVQ